MMVAIATAGLAAAGQDEWLTTILRPAGSLDRPALARLCEALGYLAASSDIAVLDLTAAVIASPRAFARNLRAPAGAFDRAGRCLLVVGASAELIAELERAAVPVVSRPFPAPGSPDPDNGEASTAVSGRTFTVKSDHARDHATARLGRGR